jgi:uncharacterized membrane protein YbhN (UPF0104 family)
VVGIALVLAIRASVARAQRSAAMGIAPSTWASRLGEIALVLRRPRVWIRSYAWGLAADAIDVTMIGLCASAVGLSLDVWTLCATLVAINVAIVVPTTPGQLGAFEAGAVAALLSRGVDSDLALVFALVYHAAHVLPATVAGAVVLATWKPSRAPRGLAT